MKKKKANLRRLLLIPFLVATCITAVVLLVISTHGSKLVSNVNQPDSLSAATVFTELFNGKPTRPMPFSQHPSYANWDVFTHYRDYDLGEITPSNSQTVVQAHHGSNCEPPHDASGNIVSHTVNTYDNQVFICADHLMTAINGGEYGAIYLTPNHMVDFSAGEASITYDMSTFRTASRDWIDVWITPMDDALMGPLEKWRPSLQGEPKRGLQFLMNDRGGASPFKTVFVGNVYKNHIPTQTGTSPFLEDIVSPLSAQRRDLFKITVSRTRFKATISKHMGKDSTGRDIYGSPITLLDNAIPGGLDWSQGVVQFAHHSYNPYKDCGMENHRAFRPCGPDTWHWGNIEISPSKPFTMIKADKIWSDIQSPAKFTFNQPAPSNAYLRFFGFDSQSTDLLVSYNNGASWLPGQIRRGSKSESHFTYWMPIPQGTTSVTFKGTQDSNWGAYVQNPTIWSINTPIGGGVPVPTTVVSTPAPIIATPRPSSTQAPPVSSAQFTSQISIDKSQVQKGQSLLVNAKVTANTSTTGLVYIEIYDQAGNKYLNKAFDNQTFATNVTKTYTETFLASQTLSPGMYYAKVGVFGTGWNNLLHWDDGVSFNVVNAPVATPIRTPTPTPASTAIGGPLSSGSTVFQILAAGTPTNGVYPTLLVTTKENSVRKILFTKTNIRGNAQANIFETIQFTYPGSIDVQQTRFEFVNDESNKAIGEDRNLVIRSITINGHVYDPAAQTTLSTGTYNSASGCGPGFKQSNILHCNGFFILDL